MIEIKLKPKKVKKIKGSISGISDYILMLLIPVFILIIWQIYSSKGLINISVLPSPSIIFSTIVDLTKGGDLFRDLGISLLRVIKGYVFGCVFGITLGTLLGLSKKLDKALVVLIGILRPIPVIAWVPVLILWLGIGETSKVVVICIGTFWPVLLNTIHGIKNVDKKYMEVGSILEKKRFIILTKIIFPSALPSIFTGLRIGIGSAWMSVVGAELIAASSGIGYLISYARELSQPDVMLVGVFSIGIIGLLIDTFIKIVEKRVLKWNINS
ncbi:ABC transporter permease [Clostridium sp. WILCCON 0269]|uniref:ABC transporter permease n=1 Tax=Candidatus Clostridium eludens TaxID=3381663 RepID=A0ABW8SHN0_9CLOT